MSLRAPIAVPVEIAAEIDRAPRRVFRLAWSVGEDGVRLERPAPFEPGRRVTVRLRLPGATDTLALEARVERTEDDTRPDGEDGGRELVFLAPGQDERRRIGAYVTARLGLPSLPGEVG